MPNAARTFLPTRNALFEFFLIVLGVLAALAVDYMQLASVLFEDRAMVIRLARNEMAYATGTWYALSRMKHDFDFLRSEIVEHPLMKGIEVKPVLKLP